ncbi:MAG: peptide deformylase [Rhizobacter sp.]|nr:peptide deformylase [Burkholderiales bacterium]
MALLPILEYPDARLKRIASPVTEFTPAIKKLVDDMADTMYDAPGIGLAATQVNVHKRIVVIDISETKNDLKVFINPQIVMADGEIVGEEGCLSVPGYYDTVKRASHVVVRAQDALGKTFELEATDLMAVCIQHEMDHLIGTVFVDHLSQLKQIRVKTRMKKRLRETERA